MRVLSPSLAIVATVLLTTGAWAVDTFLPGAVMGAALCLLLIAPVIWALRRAVDRRIDALRRFEARLSEVAASGWGLRMPETGRAKSADAWDHEGDDGPEIARLTRTVNGMLDREEQAVARQRRFASDASHELRTPIAGLRARIEVALVDPDDTDLVGTLRDALGDVERLHQIADDLLALARLDEADGSTVPRSRLDLTGLVRAELAARTERVPVRSSLQEGVYVAVNRPQLCRALVNLLSNAERYAQKEIGVILRTEDDEAVLEVCDDGPGIASGDRERIFDRFTRLDSARSRADGGSGLGLPVAREIVAAHGGRLHAAPSERGARLVMRLPQYHRPGERMPERPERTALRPPAAAAPRTRRG